MPSAIEIRFCRHVSQEVCPYSRKFSREMREPAFAPREALLERDARALAVELLGMSQSEFSAVFSKSPIKRVKFTGLKRNASVVLGRPGPDNAVPALVSALADPAPLVRRQAAWALGAIGSAAALAALHERLALEDDPAVADAVREAIAAVPR
jgi:epoxyqueuosine reductase